MCAWLSYSTNSTAGSRSVSEDITRTASNCPPSAVAIRYGSLDHVVVAGDEHELLNRLQQIPGFEASARQRASTIDDPFLECLE